MSKISDTTIEEIKTRVPILDIVEPYVTLKRAGASYKGLCPFHDERTPSFNVSPATNTYHCFGCGQGGDNIGFLQEIDGLTFRDAVQKIADTHSITIAYEEGDGDWQNNAPRSNKNRLYEIHQTAAAAYAYSLQHDPQAEPARNQLSRRGFTPADATTFGCGYAPTNRSMADYLTKTKGFTADEVITAGLAYKTKNGRLRDRFSGRLTWTIKNGYGKPIGFGARKLHDNDPISGKYINTAETPIYKKSNVLYGLDIARTHIRKHRQAIVVEGYTDVMAMHLAGFPNTVASCGTAFTASHLNLLKRIIGDDGEIVFAFDDDAAGHKAAQSTYKELNASIRRLSAMPPIDGLDPDELRQKKGPEGIREAMRSRIPLSRMVIETTLKQYPTTTPEERRVALDAVLPYLADISDEFIRREYADMVARHLRYDAEQVMLSVTADSTSAPTPAPQAESTPDEGEAPAGNSLNLTRAERAIFEILIQHFSAVEPLLGDFDTLVVLTDTPTGQALIDVIDTAYVSENTNNDLWPQRVLAHAGNLAPAIQEMIYNPVGDPPLGKKVEYAKELVVQVVRHRKEERIKEIQFELASPTIPAQRRSELFTELVNLQRPDSPSPA